MPCFLEEVGSVEALETTDGEVGGGDALVVAHEHEIDGGAGDGACDGDGFGGDLFADGDAEACGDGFDETDHGWGGGCAGGACGGP